MPGRVKAKPCKKVESSLVGKRKKPEEEEESSSEEEESSSEVSVISISDDSR